MVKPKELETCECCGAIIPIPFVERPYGLTLTEYRIYNYVAKHSDCELNHIANAIYGRELNGESNVVQVHLCRVRTKITPHGLLLKTSHRGPGATYRLEKAKADVHL